MAKGPDKKTKPKFTIAKDTTYLTEPLDKDGYPDFLKAINDRLRQGVTPDNNANVLLWKASGPHPEGATMPAGFFKLLGIATPPDKGDYFVRLLKYLSSIDPKMKPDEKYWAMLDRIGERPWKAKDFPQVAKWLKANDKPLAHVVEASKRTHHYLPLLPTETADKQPTGLVGVLLPSVQCNREFATTLVIRAMMHLGEGRVEEAWQDLLACHRLGRLVARGGCLIEHLVGVAIDNLASQADLTFLDSAKLDAKQAMKCLQDLQKLPPKTRLSDFVDTYERFMFLDAILLVDRRGTQCIAEFAGVNRDLFAQALDPKANPVLYDIDWDPALRSANRFYDRCAAAMRVQDRPTREKQLAEIANDLAKIKSDLFDLGGISALVDAKKPGERGKLLGDLMLALWGLPGLPTGKLQQTADRDEQKARNLHLAFGLAAYRSDIGKYPAKLDNLAPKYLPKIPDDLFTGKPLIYCPAADGYLLYSFGVNGIDDQGRNDEDNPPGDDLRVRMPLPPTKN